LFYFDAYVSDSNILFKNQKSFKEFKNDHSKSETVKIHYFPYKIAPLISFSGAIL